MPSRCQLSSLLISLVAAGCTCGDIDTDHPFFCQSDEDCAAGYSCLANICHLPTDVLPDSGTPDAGPGIDSGTADAGPIDAGPVDSGVIDSGVIDSGTIDSGTIDGGAIDSGAIDSGSDAGFDAGPDLCGPSVGVSDAGVVAVYCALHRTLTIDGALGDWAGVPFTALSHETAQASFGAWAANPAVDDPDLSSAFALQWDDQYLYLAVAVTDDVRALHPASSQYYADDAVEVFWDGNHNRTTTYGADDRQQLIRADSAAEYTTGSSGGGAMPGLVTGVKVATADAGIAAGWVMEMAVPWTALGALPASWGRTIGFDLGIDDDDNLATQVRKHYFFWSRTLDAGTCLEPVCSTAQFGAAVLTGVP